MYEQWLVAGRLGKHRSVLKSKPCVSVVRASQTGLATLPSEILEVIFRCLYEKPAAAVNLAQTCQALASEYRTHRANITQQCVRDLCPVFSVSVSRFSGSHADINVWWRKTSTLRHLYALSQQPGAIDIMWQAAFLHIKAILQQKGHRSEFLTRWGWDATRHPGLERTCHSSILCHIQLESATRLDLPAWWLHKHIIESAASTLETALRESGCRVHIRMKLYRVVANDLFFLLASGTSGIVDDEADVSESESNFSSYISSWEDLWEDCLRPEAPRLPVSQQVYVITGAWFSGKCGKKADVCGDQVIDQRHLDQDFCTWQSCDRDLWMYEPYTCERCSEPKWFYT